MKNLFLTSIICIFASLNSAAAQNALPAADGCARYESIRPKLNLRSSYGNLSYNYDYDSENLDIMAARNNIHESGMYTAGLSLVDIDWSTSLNTIARTVGDTTCVIPASIDVFVGYRNPIIYISNDIDKNSCRYEMVMRHEHQHQQINIAILEYFLPIIKQELQKALSVVKVREVQDDEDSDKVTDDMNNDYAEFLRPLISRFQATMENENRRLDNRENYQYESQVCGD